MSLEPIQRRMSKPTAGTVNVQQLCTDDITGLKRKARKSYKRRKSSSGMKMPKIPSVIKKVAIGVGAASLAGMAVGLIAPQFSGIARPIAALAAGGIPGVAGELLINQGLLGNITGMFGGGGINETRLASGL